MLETLEKLVMQVVDLTFEQFVEERAARKAPENQEPDTLQSLRRQADATRTAFYRLVGFLRDIIKLRAGLAAGEIPRFARPRMPRDPVADADPDEDKDAPPPAPRVLDPRMKPVAAYLVAAVRAAPRNRVKPDIHQKIPVRLQQAIHADPGFTLTGAEIAVQLCKEFRLPYNIAKLSRDPILSQNLAKPPPLTPQPTGPP
jgi:hypothetical protein